MTVDYNRFDSIEDFIREIDKNGFHADPESLFSAIEFFRKTECEDIPLDISNEDLELICAVLHVIITEQCPTCGEYLYDPEYQRDLEEYSDYLSDENALLAQENMELKAQLYGLLKENIELKARTYGFAYGV